MIDFGTILIVATVALMTGLAVLAVASKGSKCNTCGWRDGCRQLGADDDCKRNRYRYWEPVE